MSKRFDGAHAAYLTLNGAIVAFLLLPIAIVIIFALNPTPYIAFPPVGVTTTHPPEPLYAAGADEVVDRLGSYDIEALRRHLTAGLGR